MDYTFLSPGRFCLRADIYLVPAAGDTVTSETIAERPDDLWPVRGVKISAGMSQTRELPALPDVSRRATGARARILRSEREVG